MVRHRRLLTRLRRYPPRFLARHPLRAARNLVGNHPSALADRYLLGLEGLEIGGATHNDFFLNTVNADRVQAPPTTGPQVRYAGRVMPVDHVVPGEHLPFPDDSFDFVIASHVLEHSPDPMGALLEWARVAGRYVFVIVPRRDNEFDRDRPLTELSELRERFGRSFESDEDRHWSVWSPQTFVAMCEAIGLQVLEVQDPDDKRGNGFSIVISAEGITAEYGRARRAEVAG